jgi:hypothetical protein
MKVIVIILLLNVTSPLLGLSQSKDEYLIKVFEGEYDELGVTSGYVNLEGDTIVPMGKYYYCYTDTLKNYAIVLKSNRDLIAIDRNGNELFEVYWFDNGPDYVEEGLFRIRKNGKIGFSDLDGKIVIEPQFDCAFPFENGRAKVSNNCKTIQEGEYSLWISEYWKYIDRNGKVIH